MSTVSLAPALKPFISSWDISQSICIFRQVRGFIADMEARRGLGHKSLAGERCAAYAAEVLISLSGAAGSDGTRHSGGSSAAAEPQKAGRQHAGGGEAESVMISPARKRARL